MFPIIDYTFQELIELLKDAKEISQKDNINANAKLFILENDVIFKMYIPQSEEYMRNVNNLLLIKKCFALKQIEEIVLPIELVKLNDKIIGYLMPYVRGQTLESFLYESSTIQKYKVEVFSKLADIISNLPRGVYIGDLHMRNIIVSLNYDIHLIDIDGFSMENGELLTVPTPLPDIVGKYYDFEGKPIISRNSDIFCVYHMFMQWVGNGFDILESDYRESYFDFLSGVEECKTLFDELRTLYDRTDNVISAKNFLLPSIEQITLGNFMKKTKICEENEKANNMLEYYWRSI